MPAGADGTSTIGRGRALPVLDARAGGSPSGEANSAATAVAPDPFDTARRAGARIAIVTLGCDKNTVDSERYAARLAGAGGVIADGEDADVVVINTCGFIDVAKEESIETILDAVRLKREGRVRSVVAVGCLVQRYGDELRREIPEVDLFLGLTDAARLVPELRARGLLPRDAPNMAVPLRLLARGATRHSAFLKISEGCDHGCAFCAIPLMRGKHRSTPIERLVAEAQELEAQGAVELCLVSQDTTWYGRDLQRGVAPADEFFVGRAFSGMAGGAGAEGGGGASGAGAASGALAPSGADARGAGYARIAAPAHPASRTGLLPDLLRALLDGTSIPWFRLFYMYPSGIRPELVELIASEPRVLPYLDMPIQHGSDTMLARMRRPERRRTILERVNWLRAAVPDLTLRTTVIVGFPGESDREFDELLELLDEVRFDRVGAFPYSVEEGTPAALMPGQVDEDVKRERMERLLDLQRAIELERHESWIGRETVALIEERVGRVSNGAPILNGAIGRTATQAPEVDGVVHIAEAGDANVGELVRVRITGALEDDLVAERVW